MTHARENILGTEKIGKLLATFAIPGIVSMVVNSFYNIVDQIFIGHGVDYLGNGATTVIFPMITLAMAFSLLFGDGAAAFLSLKLGQKQEEQAANGCIAGILGFFITSVFITILYLLFLKPLCVLFGATQDILPYAMDYGRIITLGLPFSAFCAGGSSIIRADGSPRFNMLGLFLGTAINLALDPLFIFVFGWGVKGAAFATILGQIANAILNIHYFRKKIRCVSITKKMIAPSFKFWGKVSKLGVSSFITQISLVIAMTLRNNVLVTYGAKSAYGPNIPITTLGITMKCFSIIMSIVLGLCVGAQPIFGYNYGSGKYDRVKQTFKLVAILSTIIGLIAFFFAQVTPMLIIKAFGNYDDLYNEFAVKCMRIYLLLIPTMGIQILSGIFFQSLGYPVQSSILSLSKQVIFQVPLTIILPIYLGVEGVLWCGPSSDVLSIITTLIILLLYWKKIFSKPKNN